MNAVLWVLQIVLALAFLLAGVGKVTQPKEKLRQRMAYVEDFSEPAVKAIGTAEILGTLGLVLPAATGIATWLTPVAAAALVVLMIGAVATHLRRNEANQIVFPVVLGIVALIIAWGRFGPYSL